jgi:hypothetical protein
MVQTNMQGRFFTTNLKNIKLCPWQAVYSIHLDLYMWQEDWFFIKSRKFPFFYLVSLVELQFLFEQDKLTIFYYYTKAEERTRAKKKKAAAARSQCMQHTRFLFLFLWSTIGFIFIHVGPKYLMLDLKKKLLELYKVV